MVKGGASRDHAADETARRIIEKTGGDVRLALPLGLGKANGIANALTRAARDDRSISLTILTALTLQRPATHSDLERRFLDPAGDRLFGRYEPLLYAAMMDEGTLPPNIEVREFFFQAGQWLGNEYAQRHHVSANYTHALRYAIDRMGIDNVIWAIDYPYQPMKPAVDFIESFECTEDEMHALCHGNAERVFHIDPE